MQWRPRGRAVRTVGGAETSSITTRTLRTRPHRTPCTVGRLRLTRLVMLIDPAEERWMAERAGSTTVESPPRALRLTRFAGRFMNLIERAVHATAA